MKRNKMVTHNRLKIFRRNKTLDKINKTIKDKYRKLIK